MPEPLRYVILHHTGIAEPHYDLMFEREPGGALLTLRSRVWPITVPTDVEPLPDHRRHYLDYEGPVSNRRGVVRRVQSGTYRGDLRSGFPTNATVTLLTPEPTELLVYWIIDGGPVIEPRHPPRSSQQ